jgi:hypothetical protein
MYVIPYLSKILNHIFIHQFPIFNYFVLFNFDDKHFFLSHTYILFVLYVLFFYFIPFLFFFIRNISGDCKLYVVFLFIFFCLLIKKNKKFQTKQIIISILWQYLLHDFSSLSNVNNFELFHDRVFVVYEAN